MRSTTKWCWRWSAPPISIDGMAGVRAAIITGQGEKSFCAGGDIEAWSAHGRRKISACAWVRHGHRAFDALARLRQPLIAALNGHALGGGLELAATAPISASPRIHVKLGSPETGLGIIPGLVRHAAHGAPLRIAARPPHGASGRNIYGRRRPCASASSIRVVAKGESLTAAKQMAAQLAVRGPLATAVDQDADQRRRRRGGRTPPRSPGRLGSSRWH